LEGFCCVPPFPPNDSREKPALSSPIPRLFLDFNHNKAHCHPHLSIGKKQISSDVLVPRSKDLLVLLSAKGNDFEQRAGRRSP
jgi:hypothetical protein